MPIHFEKAIEDEIDKLLKTEVITESDSKYCSRIVPISKPGGFLGMCIDFRTLNKLTVKDNYTSSRIDEILDSVSIPRIFTTLDATSGYYQTAINPEDTHKTAFKWKNKTYKFKKMPFGLCNAPSTFQRIMDKIFAKEMFKFIIPYIDDIIILSKDEEEHERHVKIVFNKLKSAGILLNRKKCNFYREEIKILGNIVTKGKVKPDTEKVKAIRNCIRPTNIKELRRFLGLCNYTRNFVENYAKIYKKLNSLLQGESKRGS